MWHHGSEEDVDGLAVRLGGFPKLEEAFLQRDFLLVELPVVVDGDGLAFVDEGFYVRDIRFAGCGHVALDVLAAIGRVELILENNFVSCTHSESQKY